MSRPILDPDKKLSARFTFRLTEDELRDLFTAAKICGMAPGVMIHKKLFKGKFPEPKMARIDKDTYYELKKIGVNLNQLTKQVNSKMVPQGLTVLILKLQRQQDLIINLLLHDRQSENR